ncbi:putative disease resistance RPP13-like protein 1 [Humulus lupulus]|uniref:putative disease resistance RPP13-like protein 1 n=1 Tax=Humulus lupulus TaxID=3486 RepID=UPI002B407091|nr:putative disease resistance RPP13-like protein 1 [Humulus lupulus]
MKKVHICQLFKVEVSTVLASNSHSNYSLSLSESLSVKLSLLLLMAAEIVVGALVSASLNILLEKIASRYVVEFLKGKKRSGFSSRLYDMKMKFLALSAVLADAEQKQNKVPGVKEWLDELKDVVDDAEDLFAGIEYDALKLKITEKEKSTAIAAKVSNKLSKLVNLTGSKRKNEMDEILRRLEQFEKQISILRLVSDVKKEELTERSPTTSLPDEPEVYGRDKDKDGLLKLLMSEDSGSSSSQKIYEVIPIVGMGGVGKTTLAQTLFNDEQVKNKFEVLAWVYVSDKFDAMAVTKTILQCIAPGESFNNMSLDSLQVSLSKKLMGKKFFIVLDDAWEEEYVCWKNVMKPLDDGVRGSKMIVTTRSANVADDIRSGDTHQLSALSEDDCWELFANHASNGNPRKFNDNPELESIGRKLVGKCKGLPLAAKVLGGLLRSTWDVDRWEQIARSNVWELSKTLPAVLEVSYHYLPPHLKGCFAYCSIFPKGYKFDKKELVLIWMAENLVKHSEGSRSMEEVGNAYFDDLVSLSFFQIKTREFAENIVSMHDLIVDLARAVSGKYNYLLEHSEDIGKFEKKTRHLGCTKELLCCNEKISSYDFEPTRLRTFLALRSEYQDICIPKEVVHHLVSKLKRLRVVSFRYSGPVLSSASIHSLLQSFGKNEVKNAILDIPRNKAPASNGFCSFIFQNYWDLIGEEVSEAALSFLETRNLLKEINACNNYNSHT